VTAAADPREIGDLLQTWINIQMETVDDLVAEAREKVTAIPRWPYLTQLVGELMIRLSVLEAELRELRQAQERRR
jgi:hypothetical protein